MSVELAANIGPSIPHVFAKEGMMLWNREAPLFKMARKEMGHSNAVYWSVSNQGAAPSSNNVYVGEGETVNTTNEFNVDDITALTLNRAIVRNGFSISHTELAQVASLQPGIAANIVIERLKRAWLNNMAATARIVELQLLAGTGVATSNSTGNSVQGLVGLMAIFNTVLDPSGYPAYAGKNVAGYSGLTPTVANESGATLTGHMLDELIASIQTAAGSFKPDFLMCSPKTAVQIKAIGDQYFRLNSQPGDQRLPWQLGLRDVPTPDAPVVQYNGIPVIQNSAWGGSSGYDGYIVTGMMENLVIDVLPYANWGDTISEEDKEGLEGFAGMLDSVGLPFFTWPYAKTASTVSFVQELEFQLKIEAPNRFGLIFNIATS
jgi:hypothetical protein